MNSSHLLKQAGRFLYPAYEAPARRAFALFERLGYRPANEYVLPFVPPTGARLAAMLESDDYDNLERTLRKLHEDSVQTSLAAMMQSLDELEKSDLWIDRLWGWYRNAHSQGSRLALILGLIRHAGHKRDSARPGILGRSKRQDARLALEEAEKLLDKAVKAAEDPVEMHILRLLTARGLFKDEATNHRRFRRITDLAPLHYRAHLVMLENLKKQWCGSDEAMLEFARTRARQAPLGNPVRSLVMHAHLELALLTRQRHGIDPADYCQMPKVQQEIVDAWYDTFLQTPGGHDVFDEELCNYFAAMLHLCGRTDLAAMPLAQMERRCLPQPWSRLGHSPKEKNNPAWIVDRIEMEMARKAKHF